MITIHILLPFCGDILHLTCEENENTDSLMQSIKKITPGQGVGRNWLCHVDCRRLLRHNSTLMENDVREGSNLVLV